MQRIMCSNGIGTTGGNAETTTASSHTRRRRRRRRQQRPAASLSASAALVVAIIAASSCCCLALGEAADVGLILRGASSSTASTGNAAWNGRPTADAANAASAANPAAAMKLEMNANADLNTATVGDASSIILQRSLKEEENKNNEKDNGKNQNGKEDPAKADKNNPQNVPPPTPRPTIMPTSSGDTFLTYIGEGGMLGTCQGDCDTDADCQRSLRCFQRNAFESVPNCNGFGTEGTDYCACFDDDATLRSHSVGSATYFVNGAFGYLKSNGGMGRSTSCSADFDLARQTNYQDFVDGCSRPLIVNGQVSSQKVRDLCRYTCGVCIDIPPPTAPGNAQTAETAVVANGNGPPPTPRPTKRPTKPQPTYGDRDPTPYPTLTPWPTVTAWPTVTMWPTITAWPTVTMWPTVTAYPTVTFYPTAEEDRVPAPAPVVPLPPGQTAAPATTAPVTPFPTAKPTISMAPTRYYPAMTIEVSVATQVAMFTTAGGHIRVGNTKWTRADYLLDAVIYSTSKMLEERLDGLVVEDYLDDDAWQDDDQTAEIVAGQRAELDFVEDLDGFDSTDVGEEGYEDGYRRQRRQRMLLQQQQQHTRKLVDRSLPDIDDRVAYMAPEDAPHGSRRLIVDGIVLELNWDKSTISHVGLESLLENPDLSKNDKKALNGLPGISWQKAYLRYWVYAADSPDDMISQKKTARISRKVKNTVQAAMDDGDFLAWAQYADPKIAGLSLVGLEHEAPINKLPLPISPYATPIATGTMDPIRIAGMALFIFALVGSFCVSKIAIRRRRKREARAFWGSLETDKDIDALLNVGLIMPESSPGGDGAMGVGGSGATGSGQTSNSPGKDGSGNGSDDARPVYSPQVLARQMNRSELGYSKDNSMLMGGYQRTMQIAVDDEEEEGQEGHLPKEPEVF